MKNAWRKLLVAGFIGSLTVAAGCVVGSSDDDNTGGTGGSSGSGGSTGGAAGSGATGGQAGSGATGGMAGAAGGGGSTAYVCDNDKTGPGTPAASCDPVDANDPCQVCVQTNCCAEWKTCLAETPNDACAFGGTAGEGEIICIQDCIDKAGIADADTIKACAGNCASPGCSTISSATNDMVACLNGSCFTECLQPTTP